MMVIALQYPVGPLLAELAHRILKNLELIDQLAPKWGSPQQNEPPYSDTQLMISMLGVLIFPQERSPNAIGELLAKYEGLNRVIKIVWSKGPVEFDGADGKAVVIDPHSIKELPRLLRNSIAHFNVRPINVDGRFGGLRIWNRNSSGKINFIADLDFDELRPLAMHILRSLDEGGLSVELEDPPDPMDEITVL